jgi:ABC-type lipoprotein export system ATPase subunit
MALHGLVKLYLVDIVMFYILKNSKTPVTEAFGSNSQKVGLSGGELQRAAIARALINDPPIIVADEPTAHLDGKLSLEVMDMLAALKEEGRTVVVASHDPIVSGHHGMAGIIEVRDGAILLNEPVR